MCFVGVTCLIRCYCFDPSCNI